mgnify:CR=1 FL=1
MRNPINKAGILTHRVHILNWCPNSKKVLVNANFIFIGFQHNFREIDNLSYFKYLMNNDSNYIWELSDWFGDQNSVLFGKRI